MENPSAGWKRKKLFPSLPPVEASKSFWVKGKETRKEEGNTAGAQSYFEHKSVATSIWKKEPTLYAFPSIFSLLKSAVRFLLMLTGLIVSAWSLRTPPPFFVEWPPILIYYRSPSDPRPKGEKLVKNALLTLSPCFETHLSKARTRPLFPTSLLEPEIIFETGKMYSTCRYTLIWLLMRFFFSPATNHYVPRVAKLLVFIVCEGNRLACVKKCHTLGFSHFLFGEKGGRKI